MLFSIKTKSEPVVIVGDDDVEVTYKLCQLTGEQRLGQMKRSKSYTN
jgi:hypothetical protein